MGCDGLGAPTNPKCKGHVQDFQQISPGFLLLACISKQMKGEKS